jgi:sulfatase modifying factor 1
MSNVADLSYVDFYSTSPSYSFDGSGFRLSSPSRTNDRKLNFNSKFSPHLWEDMSLNSTKSAGSAQVNTVFLNNMAMVTVGQPGNKKDERTGNGSVNYPYNIGKYEVTIQQYTDFLNAVAASDPYKLYNPSMETDLTVAGIARSGNSGSYSYRVIGPSGATPSGASSPGNRPIAYVSWFDAARFANWMHNGQGAGDTEQGAYTLNGTTSGQAVAANKSAKFHIPKQNEWYKAAYYSPQLNSGHGGYYVFATQNNTTPGSVTGNNINQRNKPNQANYFNGGFAVTQAITPSASQNYLTDVGAFTKSASFYGTYDQAGNVYEWTDGPGQATKRSLRGAYWVSNVADTSYLDEYILPPDYESSGSGFRLASLQNVKNNNYKSKPKQDSLIGPFSKSSNQYDSITNVRHFNRDRLLGQPVWSSRTRLASSHTSQLETSTKDLIAASPYTDNEGQFLTDSPLRNATNTIANRTVLDALRV